MQPLVRVVAFVSLCFFLSGLSFGRQTQAQTTDSRYYDIGNPTVTDIWLDPINGDDNNNGSTRWQALKTLTAAWNRIPAWTTLTTTGYRINILPGDLPCERGCANYYAVRWGTYQYPIIIRAVDGRGTVRIHGGLNIYGVRYLYLIDLNLIAGNDSGYFANNVLHLERVDHLLMRGLNVRGKDPAIFQEVIKANQCRYLYLEESEISGARSTAVDFFATQNGHILSNRIHDAGSWGLYLKGGSAYFRIEANEIYDSFFGFSAGEGAELTYMEAPWLHYEVYDIKFINNVVHDIRGTAMAVYGGYNVLLAHNTLYRIAANNGSSRTYGLITIGQGIRICNGTKDECVRMTNQGAWGPYLPGYENGGQVIPNRNVFVYNNLFYNPASYGASGYQFVVYGPATPPASFLNLPENLATDENLQIRGNLIWNGTAKTELIVESPSWGCRPSNPTCNSNQLRSENTINTVEPQFFSAASRDFRVVPTTSVLDVKTYAIPDFRWNDAPVRPAVPQGNLSNIVDRDRNGFTRPSIDVAGAHSLSSATVVSSANYQNPVAAESLVTAFGTKLASSADYAKTSPLPIVLGGTSVSVRDAAGVTRFAQLFAVSPTQVNYQIPPGTAPGMATVSIEGTNGVSLAKLQINRVAAGIFTADANGKGFAAATTLRVRADGSQIFEPVTRFDSSQNHYAAIPIDASVEKDRLFLVLYGTGIRNRSSLDTVKATVGNIDTQVLYAGAQGTFLGLDQVNLLLPPSLAGRGDVDIVLTVDGQPANTVRVNIR